MGDWDDETDEAPMFGCACENPLCVDTVCAGCIAWLEAQDAEASTDPNGTR